MFLIGSSFLFSLECFLCFLTMFFCFFVFRILSFSVFFVAMFLIAREHHKIWIFANHLYVRMFACTIDAKPRYPSLVRCTVYLLFIFLVYVMRFVTHASTVVRIVRLTAKPPPFYGVRFCTVLIIENIAIPMSILSFGFSRLTAFFECMILGF